MAGRGEPGRGLATGSPASSPVLIGPQPLPSGGRAPAPRRPLTLKPPAAVPARVLAVAEPRDDDETTWTLQYIPENGAEENDTAAARSSGAGPGPGSIDRGRVGRGKIASDAATSDDSGTPGRSPRMLLTSGSSQRLVDGGDVVSPARLRWEASIVKKTEISFRHVREGEPAGTASELPRRGPSQRRKAFLDILAFRDPAMTLSDAGRAELQQNPVLMTLCWDLPERGAFGLTFSSSVRIFFIRVAKASLFSNLVLATILANCCTLAIDSAEPGHEDTPLGQATTALDYAFTSVFLTEMCIKVMAHGFIGSPGTYIRDPWNILDFVVVSLSVLGWLPGVSTGTGATAIRTVRVLRPLRTVTTIPGLRKLVLALINSLPMLLDVCVLLSFLFLLYGIIGVELLAGKMSRACWPVTNWSADDPTFAGPAPLTPVWGNPNLYNWPGPFATSCSGPLVGDYPSRAQPGQGLMCAPGWWCGRFVGSNYGYSSFDNIGVAFLNVLYCLTTSGWTDVMYEAMDALAPSVWIYFCAIVISSAWFAGNLAVAVLYEQFVKKEAARTIDAVHAQPLHLHGSAGSLSSGLHSHGEMDAAADEVLAEGRSCLAGVQNWLLRNMVNSGWFMMLTIACIVLNTAFLGMIYYGMSDAYSRTLEMGNLGLTAFFVLELLLKLFALGPRAYAEDRMNLFDALVVVFGVVEIILGYLNVASANLNVLRCFRLLRVLKLARSWHELNVVLTTVLNSLSAIGYLSLLLFLFIFIMAVLGMQVFGYQLIFCDQYNLGASVQPVCPYGLSTEAGTCPAGHYYDCYAPCDPTQVGEWVTGAPGGYGWPGTPTGLCKAYGPPPRRVLLSIGGSIVRQLQYVAGTEFWIWVGPSYRPRANFDDWVWAFVTVFQILTTENWNNVAWDGMRATHYMAGLYSIFVLAIGFYIFLNLFLTILLDNFSTSNNLDHVPTSDRPNMTVSSHGGNQNMREPADSGPILDSKHGGVPLPKPATRAVRVKQMSTRTPSLRSLERRPSFGRMPQLNGRAFLIFGPQNALRVLAARATSHALFEYAMLVVIVVSSLTLALDSPRLDPKSVTKAAIDVMDKIFVVLFVFEMMTKMLALGVFLPTNAYVRNPWNLVDGVIAGIGLLGWLLAAFPPPSAGGQGASASQLSALRAFRTVRALRPLRLANRIGGIKVVISALGMSLPGILNVGMVIVLFYGIFAIIAMNFFLGELYSCTWSPGAPQPYGDVGLVGLEQGDGRVDPRVILDPKGGTVVDKAWCTRGMHTITWPEGVPPYQLVTTWARTYACSFDNIGLGMLALFEASTTSLWLDVMWSGTDSVGLGKQPTANYDRSQILFFVVVMIVCCFFMLNLFVGVTIDKFVQLKEIAEGHSILLTREQRHWVEIQTIMASCKPVRVNRMPKNRLRRLLFKAVTSDAFDAGIMAVIFCSIFVMAMRHSDETQGWQDFQFYANLVFSCIFGLEAVLKLLALGVSYVRDSWNIFDFVVVVICFVGVYLDMTTSASSASNTNLALIRVLRVARLFRLIPKAKRLLKLFQTLAISLPGLANVGSVMFLFFYICATVGMNLFGSLRRNYYLKRHANWEDFPNSMLLLFRMTGGENWNGLMHESMNMASCILITDPTLPIYGNWYNKADLIWQDMTVDQWDDHCSPNETGTVLFYLFQQILLAYVMLNLFIAVILDNFQRTEADDLPITRHEMVMFARAWAQFDADGSYYVDSSALPHILSQVEPPLGVRGLEERRGATISIILMTAIPEHGNGKIHFVETLHALAARVAGTYLPDSKEGALHHHLAASVPSVIATGKGAPRATAAQVHAALFVQAAVRGFLARHGVVTKGTYGATDGDRAATAKGLRWEQGRLITSDGQQFRPRRLSASTPTVPPPTLALIAHPTFTLARTTSFAMRRNSTGPAPLPTMSRATAAALAAVAVAAVPEIAPLETPVKMPAARGSPRPDPVKATGAQLAVAVVQRPSPGLRTPTARSSSAWASSATPSPDPSKDSVSLPAAKPAHGRLLVEVQAADSTGTGSLPPGRTNGSAAGDAAAAAPASTPASRPESEMDGSPSSLETPSSSSGGGQQRSLGRRPLPPSRRSKSGQSSPAQTRSGAPARPSDSASSGLASSVAEAV